MKRLLLVLAAALALVATSCGSNGSNGGSSAAAVVNGSVISIDQLNTELALQVKLQGDLSDQARASIYGDTESSFSTAFTASVLSQMIATQLLTDEAAARGVTVSSTDTQAAEQAIQQQYAGVTLDQPTHDALVERFATISALNSALSTDFAAPAVTDEEVRATYDQGIDQLVAQNGDFACVDLIAIGWSADATATQPTPEQEAAALATAQDVSNQLARGGSFEQLAAQYSDHAASKADGGNYGCLPKGNFPIPEIDTAAFSQPVGEVSAPLRSDYGYLLVKVRSRGVPAFEDIQADIRAQLEKQAASSSSPINNWYKSTVDTITVDVNPQIGTWDSANGVTPPEGASTQTTVGGDPSAGLPTDLSQLTGSSG